MNSRGFGYGTFVTSLLSTPLGVTEKENICAAENRIRHFLLPQHTLSDAVCMQRPLTNRRCPR
jgi:hypothetical protein